MEKIPEIEQLVEETADYFARMNYTTLKDVKGLMGEIMFRDQAHTFLLSQSNLYVRIYSETYVNVKECLEKRGKK